MTQRTWAALLAVPLIFAGLVYAALASMPFVTYAPGLTIDVLGDYHGKPIITVHGHPTYHDGGQLRMTTVSVTERDSKLDLFTLMSTWALAHDDAIYPYSVQYPDSGSQQQDAREGQDEMVASQKGAEAAALTELGYDLHPQLQILAVSADMPAHGVLKVHDVLLDVAGKPVTGTTDVGAILRAQPRGQPVPFVVQRGTRQVHVSVTPKVTDGQPLVGITLGQLYHWPFKISVNIDKNIGGPSAGLMFALSIYDTLTPGSLTDGGKVAGTGTIDAQGHVGVIGGIEQKIAGARQAGAQLFLVPPGNCVDALTAHPGSMRLAKATTLKSAISEVKAWGADHDVKLPQCKPPKAGRR